MVVGHAGVQSQGKPAGGGQAGPILALTKSVGSGSPQELLGETLPGHPACPLKGSIGTWLPLPSSPTVPAAPLPPSPCEARLILIS